MEAIARDGLTWAPGGREQARPATWVSVNQLLLEATRAARSMEATGHHLWLLGIGGCAVIALPSKESLLAARAVTTGLIGLRCSRKVRRPPGGPHEWLQIPAGRGRPSAGVVSDHRRVLPEPSRRPTLQASACQRSQRSLTLLKTGRGSGGPSSSPFRS